jgi:hypothetical protein
MLAPHAACGLGVAGAGAGVKRRALAAAGGGGLMLAKGYKPMVVGLHDPLDLRLQPQLNREVVAYCGETDHMLTLA